MVFTRDAVPEDISTDELLAWCRNPEHPDEWDATSPEGTSPELVAFYDELRADFPPVNGPDAPSEDELAEVPGLEDRLADYEIGVNHIYLAFPWGKAEKVAQTIPAVAERLGLGLYDPQGPNVFFPDGTMV